jgi:hypothetical protein
MANNITIGRFLNGKIDYKTVIDHIQEKVVAQGCKSLNNETGMCAYRGENGTKCGIGHIIPDSRYKKAFDTHESWGGPITNLLNYEHNLKKLGIERGLIHHDEYACRVSFLNRIQRAHDKATSGSFFVEEFKDKMQGVRDDFEDNL